MNNMIFPNEESRLLERAVTANDFEEVKRIVGLDPKYIVDAAWREEGITLAHIAAQLGHFEVLHFLVENGCNPFEKDWSGQTPMGYARIKEKEIRETTQHNTLERKDNN